MHYVYTHDYSADRISISHHIFNRFSFCRASLLLSCLIQRWKVLAACLWTNIITPCLTSLWHRKVRKYDSKNRAISSYFFLSHANCQAIWGHYQCEQTCFPNCYNDTHFYFNKKKVLWEKKILWGMIKLIVYLNKLFT